MEYGKNKNRLPVRKLPQVTQKNIVKDLRQRIEELESLCTVSSTLHSAETLEGMLAILIDETLAVLKAEAGAIWLYHPLNGELNFRAARGWFSQLDEDFLKPGEIIAGTVFTSGQPFISRELANDPQLKNHAKIPEGWGGACLPIRTAVNIIGVLFVSVPLPREITPGEIKLLTSLAETAGPALQSISLREQTLRRTLAIQAAIAEENARLLNDLEHANLELMLAYDATIEGWSYALDLRDRETEGHSQRVAEMTLKLSMAMGISGTELINIRRGALLHDIGKMGIPDAILLKSGILSNEERQIMCRHPGYAFEMLSHIDYLHPALEIPYCHHEKWNGTGYPRGLKGKEIPLEALIFAVVDVYDALTSDRPYRPAWTTEQARDYIQKESGNHFDPQVVETFLKQIEDTG